MEGGRREEGRRMEERGKMGGYNNTVLSPPHHLLYKCSQYPTDPPSCVSLLYISMCRWRRQGWRRCAKERMRC